MPNPRILAVALSALALSACVVAPYPRQAAYYPEAGGSVVVTDVPPPAPYVEPVPVVPYAGAIWIGGYWGWSVAATSGSRRPLRPPAPRLRLDAASLGQPRRPLAPSRRRLDASLTSRRQPGRGAGADPRTLRGLTYTSIGTRSALGEEQSCPPRGLPASRRARGRRRHGRSPGARGFGERAAPLRPRCASTPPPSRSRAATRRATRPRRRRSPSSSTGCRTCFYADRRFKLLVVLQGTDTAARTAPSAACSARRARSACRRSAGRRLPSTSARTTSSGASTSRCRAAGEIVIFNRSHYEDVLVPVVNGWITREADAAALRADQRLRAAAGARPAPSS